MACAQRCPRQCITMREDYEGFLYPYIDKKLCINCNLCERVCPTLNQKGSKRPLSVYAAINPNKNIRLDSSSGGIFSLIAEKVIASGGVVFGARFNSQWEVIHDYCDSPNGLKAFRGSKYVQSRIGNCYQMAERFLKSDKTVLFSGTSCQIAGLHNFLGKKYNNLLTIDVVCHGVPSPLVWREYINAVTEDPNSIIGKNTVLHNSNKNIIITDISFRDKRAGWKKFCFSVSGKSNEDIQNNHHSVIFSETHYENLFLGGFLKDIYLRPSCYTCPAKKGKAGSDITLADYWGVGKYHAEMDDDNGTSLVLLNTTKGQEIFSELELKKQETTYEEALSENLSIEESVKCPKLRQYFYRNYIPGNSQIITRKVLNKMKPSLTTRVKFKLNQLLSSILK